MLVVQIGEVIWFRLNGTQKTPTCGVVGHSIWFRGYTSVVTGDCWVSLLGRLGQVQCTAGHCNTLQYTAAHLYKRDIPLPRLARHCSTLQHTATHYNTVQHTAAHCSTRQHTSTRKTCCEIHNSGTPKSPIISGSFPQKRPATQGKESYAPPPPCKMSCIQTCCEIHNSGTKKKWEMHDT